jgi:hypothetical protein
MIVSHRHRFIFIKTHKTAGSSMEQALIPFCGADDIITPMESNVDSGLPRNFHGAGPLDRNYARWRLLRKVIGRHSPLLGTWYYEHMPAWRVREQLGEAVWGSYFKFCFERNPWDKVVSYFLWKRHGQGRSVPDFRDYVLKKTHRLPADGRLYLDDDGQPLVDHVGQYADFQAEFTRICARLEIAFDGDFPREKTGIAVDRRPYQDYYDEETRAVVAQLFAREIALFGYRFEGD